MKMLGKILTATAITAGAGVLAYKLIGKKLFESVLTKEAIKNMRGTEEGGPPEEIEAFTTNESHISGKSWYNNVKKERIEIDSSLGDKILADVIRLENNSDKWAIICHGFVSVPSDMGRFAQNFSQNGFNVLLPTMRGHGDSPCEYTGMGWIERLDILKWIDYIIKENPNAKIVLTGVSMGAACVLMTTGEKLPSNVVCAVADCAYTSVWDEFSKQIKVKYKLPSFPFLDAANAEFKKRSGFSLKDASSLEQVKKSVTPTLFIHGDKDDFVPFEMLDKIYETAACEKEKYVVEGAGHAVSALVAGDAYGQRVENFINKYIN